MQELKFLNALNSVPGIGVVSLRALKDHFGSYEAAWRAEESALKASSLDDRAVQALLWKRPSLNPDREMNKLVQAQISLITENEEYFPPQLKEISNPPLALYARGNLKKLRETRLMGVVGTRRPTAYGSEAAEALVKDLVRAGVTTVSGLATGIDAQVHRATLDMKGTTLAILGSGVDENSIFPPENRGLANRIAEQDGVVLSEYAPGTPAMKEHFPARNRIISGLSLGVLVVEARERSGALITARFALEQNREVFAVPGSIFSATSQGPNRLIQEGAKLVISAKDILEELGIEYTMENEERMLADLNETESSLYQLLEEPLTVDTLKEKTGFPTAVIVASLSLLELKGMIRTLGPDIYQRI